MNLLRQWVRFAFVCCLSLQVHSSAAVAQCGDALAAGAVPDGSRVPGAQLAVDRGSAGQILLSWSGSCNSPDNDYAVYEGSLDLLRTGQTSGHSSVMCSTTGMQDAAVPPAATDSYYLVVPNNGDREGSYGFDSSGRPRSAAAAGCFAQQTTACYCFEETGEIIPTEAFETGAFGGNLGLDGDVLIVGDHRAADAGESGGAAEFFERNEGGLGNWGDVVRQVADEAGDWFGFDVAVSGNTALVGAPFVGGTVGSAYGYQRSALGEWELVKQLEPAGAAGGDHLFGWGLALDGDTAVVGFRHDDEVGQNAGSAIVFERNEGGIDNWGQVKKVWASDPTDNASYGFTAAIDGDTIVIGAPESLNDQMERIGSVYILSRNQGGPNNWGEVVPARTASDAGDDDMFGARVGVSGDTVVVSAHQNAENGVEAGAVYVLQRDHGGANQWGEVVKLSPPNAAAGDAFGWAVDIVGDYVIAGASRSPIENATGLAYVFHRNYGGPNQWGMVQELTAADTEPENLFGVAVSMSRDGSRAAIGAPMSDEADTNAGSAFVFDFVYSGD